MKIIYLSVFAFLFLHCTKADYAEWNPYEKPAELWVRKPNISDDRPTATTTLSRCNQPVDINLKNADCPTELIPILRDVLAQGILNSFCSNCPNYQNRTVVDQVVYKSFTYLVEGRESDILVVRDGDHPDNAYYGNQIKQHIDQIENQFDDILTIYGFIPTGTVPNCKRGSTQTIRVGYLVTYCKAAAPPIWDF